MLSIQDVELMFPDENAVRKHWANIRWGKWAQCPYCGNQKCYIIEHGDRYKCADKKCYKKFSITVKTVFEGSNLDLTKWIKIIFFYCKRRGRINHQELETEFKVTTKTTFQISDRLDYVWKEVDREGKTLLEIMDNVFRMSYILHARYVDFKHSPFYKNPYHVSGIDNIGDPKQYYMLLRHTRYYILVFAHWIFIKDFASAEDILAETFLSLKDDKIKEYDTEYILSAIWGTSDKMWRKYLREHPKYNEMIIHKDRRSGKRRTILLTNGYLITRILKSKEGNGLTRSDVVKRKDLLDKKRDEIIGKRKKKGALYNFNSHFD